MFPWIRLRIFLIKETNCLLVDLIEPQPTKEMLQSNPAWERNYHVPQFIVFKAVKQV